MKKIKKWRLVNKEDASPSKWMKVEKHVVIIPNGQVIDDYYVWDSGDVSMVVPFTKDNNLILVKQYKHGAGQVMLEYPAGYIDQNETPVQAAKREIEDEIGIGVTGIKPLGTVIHHPTKETGKLHLFVAKLADYKTKIKYDITEEIIVMEFSIPKVLKMIENGQIWATATVAATFMALNNLKLMKLKV